MYREGSPFNRKYQPRQPSLPGKESLPGTPSRGFYPPGGIGRIGPVLPKYPSRGGRFPGGIGRIGPVLPGDSGRRGRLPGSPPKTPGKRPSRDTGKWGAGQPIVIDPKTRRPVWRWSPGSSYATKVAGVYTDPEHMRRVSQLARWKPIQREAPETVAEEVVKPTPTEPTSTFDPQAYEDYMDQQWWDKYGNAFMNSIGQRPSVPHEVEQAYNIFKSYGGRRGVPGGQGLYESGVWGRGGTGAGETPGVDWGEVADTDWGLGGGGYEEGFGPEEGVGTDEGNW